MSEQYYPITDEDIDYQEVGEGFVDGSRDPEILAMIGEIKGVRVLDVAAGDGRYSIPLLENDNQVFAGDKKFDPEGNPRKDPLLMVQLKLPPELREKYHPVRLDAFIGLPFPNGSFKGLVCTGFLYLFPEEILLKAFKEFERVLESEGRLVIDFATGIRRQRPDGSLRRGPNEVDYDLNTGFAILRNLLTPAFINRRWTLGEVYQDLSSPGQPGHIMTNTKINVLAQKV